MKNLKIRCTNSQSHRDNYFPDAKFKLTARLEDDIFIYEFEHKKYQGEIVGFNLVNVSASNLDLEYKVREIAIQKMIAYYSKFEKQYIKERDSGMYN